MKAIQRKAPQPVKGIIQRLMERIEKTYHKERSILMTAWKESVSQRIWENTEPDQLLNGQWIIKVKGSAWMNELTFNKEMITMAAAKCLKKNNIVLNELIFRLK